MVGGLRRSLLGLRMLLAELGERDRPLTKIAPHALLVWMCVSAYYCNGTWPRTGIFLPRVPAPNGHSRQRSGADEAVNSSKGIASTEPVYMQGLFPSKQPKVYGCAQTLAQTLYTVEDLRD